MLHITETTKDADTAVRDLTEAVKRHNFGVLHTYDLQTKLAEKGFDLANRCRILEVCNPALASRVLTANMAISLALPCRISVYEENGATRIGTILPTALLAMFPATDELQSIARDVEKAILAMISEAR